MKCCLKLMKGGHINKMQNKQLKKGTDLVMAIVAFIVAIGIGGLFIAGGFTQVILLKLLPLIIHQIVGWAMIGGTILAVVMKLLK
jgi:hypothetical protein